MGSFSLGIFGVTGYRASYNFLIVVPQSSLRLSRTRGQSINMSAISPKIFAAVSWVFTALAILLTAGRFWIRCKIIKKLSWDDAAHLLALLLLVAQVSIVSGAASMIYQIANYEAGDDEHYQAKYLLFVRLDIAGILVTWCCLYAVKISFLLLYHHLFRISERFIQAWWIVLGIVVLTFWILVAGSLTECGSPSALEHVGMSSSLICHSKLP